jgi:hypothetical protein
MEEVRDELRKKKGGGGEEEGDARRYQRKKGRKEAVGVQQRIITTCNCKKACLINPFPTRSQGTVISCYSLYRRN